MSLQQAGRTTAITAQRGVPARRTARRLRPDAAREGTTRSVCLPIRRVAVAACLALLAGCAGTPERDNDFGELYAGKSTTAYATDLPPATAEEAIARGDRALHAGDRDLALYRYIKALEKDPESAAAYLRVGRIHRERDRLDLAEQAFRMGLAAAPDHAGLHEGLGLTLLRSRRYEAAEVELATALAADGGQWRAHNGLGILADLKGDFEAARLHYEAALASQPDSVLLLNNVGYSRYLAGDLEEAERWLRRAVGHVAGFELGWRNLGLVHARRGDDAAALEAFRRAGKEPEALNNLGYVLWAERRHPAAERYLERAVRAAPRYYVRAHENLTAVREARAP